MVNQEQSYTAKWKDLYKVGGWSALTIAALFIVETGTYLASSAPSLADAAGWFNLFHTNRLLGLLDFGILELFGLMLFVPVFLALYFGLRRLSETWMAIAAVLAFAGIAANFATSKLFTLLALSDLYAGAATEALKAQFLAAGQAALAVSAQGGIGGSVEGGVPFAVAGLIISIVILRGAILGRAAGYAGILANAFGLAMYVQAAVAPSLVGSPFFGFFFLSTVAWFILLARGLLHLARASNT